MTTTKPTPSTPPATQAAKTRASPVPSDETLAIRALRDLRKLDARIAKAESEVTNLKAERVYLLGDLSAETKRILTVLQGGKEKADV